MTYETLNQFLTFCELGLSDTWMGETIEPQNQSNEAPSFRQYLSELSWESCKTDWGVTRLNRSIDGNPLKISGLVFERGIGTHGNSEIVYDLPNDVSYFTAYIGIDDEVCSVRAAREINGVYYENFRISRGKVSFIVIADGETLYESEAMDSDAFVKYIEICIIGRKKLTLKVLCPDGNIDYAHANWADAVLLSKKPIQAASLQYFKQPGYFLYCNNPETIIESDLLGHNKIILSQEQLHGLVSIFVEHNNHTGKVFNYGIQCLNSSEGEILIKLLRRGCAVRGWNGFEAGENAWSDAADFEPYDIALAPGEIGWIFGPVPVPIVNVEKEEGVLTGIVSLEIQGGTGDIRIFAFGEAADLDSLENAEAMGHIMRNGCGWGLNGWGQARTYKGMATHLPKIQCLLSWVVGDDTPKGLLPVSYGKQYFAGWVTHTNRICGAYIDDLYAFTDQNDIHISPYGTDVSTLSANLGNWGILYTDEIFISNLGTRKRECEIYLGDVFDDAQVMLISHRGDIIKSQNPQQKNQCVTRFAIPPGVATSYSLSYVLPANSVGGVAHFVQLI